MRRNRPLPWAYYPTAKATVTGVAATAFFTVFMIPALTATSVFEGALWIGPGFSTVTAGIPWNGNELLNQASRYSYPIHANAALVLLSNPSALAGVHTVALRFAKSSSSYSPEATLAEASSSFDYLVGYMKRALQLIEGRP